MRHQCTMHSHNHVFYSMSTRSRTGLFLSFRDSTARLSRSRPTYEDTDENDRLIDSPSHVTLNVQLPPQWFPCLLLLLISIYLYPSQGRLCRASTRYSRRYAGKKSVITVYQNIYLSPFSSRHSRQTPCKTRPSGLLGPLSRRTRNRSFDY